MPNTDPESPPPAQNFPSCPEDSLDEWPSNEEAWFPPSRPGPSGMDDDSRDPNIAVDTDAIEGATPMDNATSHTLSVIDTIVDDGPRSGMSSRSNTLSPFLGLGTSAPSSPPTSFAGIDSLKQTEADDDEDDRGVSGQSRIGLGDTVYQRRPIPPPGAARPSPMVGESSDRSLDMYTRWDEESSALSLGPDYSSKRVLTTSPSSFLQPGSRFHGTQQSERQVYEVQVEIKHVDLHESFLCGYLRIQGLTEDHPTLTTYFEGEIIGPKYSFITRQSSWGATDKIDLNHWSKFSAFRPFQKQARKGGSVTIRDVSQCENIFMRWKEHFLVPDHRVRTIVGASFEGFYYICFNQVKGEVSGIYFHSKSERFQQLELKHVEDKGCFCAMEFR